MAHYQQQLFVKIISKYYPAFFSGKKILEIGSWIANDSIRKYFHNCEYIGADVAAGPGVDVVCSGELLEFENNFFDLTVSCECFEHNPEWIATFNNMYRMVKPGGLVLMSCASIGRGEHGTSRKSPDASLTVISSKEDYYANLSKQDFLNNFNLDSMFADYRFFYNIYFCDLYFIGFKKSNTNEYAISPELISEINAIKEFPNPAYKRRLQKNINFILTFIYAKIIGERKYHDFKYFLRSKLKNTHRISNPPIRPSEQQQSPYN